MAALDVDEPMEDGDAAESETAELETEAAREPWRFWRALMVSSAAFVTLTWVIDALPARNGEPLVLRWLRALEAHPLRAPLGLTLAWLGAVRLVRCAFRRAEPTRRA